MSKDWAGSRARRPGQPELCPQWRTGDGQSEQVPDRCWQGPWAPLRTGRRGGQRRAPRLTTLVLWPVSAVEQGLVRVPEELVPGHRVYEAEAGVAVDEGQPAAQLP